MNYTWNNFTTLVAEDDPLNFKYIQLLLSRRTGINTIWAKDGIAAVNECKENKNIDVILLDLQLPGLDGIKTLKAIREFNSSIPIIIQTANTWNNEEDTCYKAGCDGFFTKPLNIDKLLIHMEKCIKSYSIIRHSDVAS